MSEKKGCEYTLYVIIGILSLLAFCTIYGIHIINPCYTDWLLDSGDLSQHYLGWKGYRNGAWTFPIGMTNQLAYPEYTSVIMTDSIPLFAVIFKILDSIVSLPQQFQYFGLWGAMCFVLQSCLAARIYREFTDNKYVITCASILTLFAPVMFYRMFSHTSLAGQWILLYILEVIFVYKKYKGNRKIYRKIAFTAILATAIHMYFVLMCGIILVGICLKDWLECKNVKRICLFLFDYIMSAGINVWLLGGFHSHGTSFEGDGLGIFSMNYNALYNPHGWSNILKDRILFINGQHEGFGYVGAGVILLLTAVLVMLGNSNTGKAVKEGWKKSIPIIIVVMLTCIVASSPIASYNDIKLYELIVPEFIIKIWSIFRASGRIIMIIPYILILVLVILAVKKASQRFVSILLTVCVILQVYDISVNLQSLHGKFSQKAKYELTLENEQIWEFIGENKNIKHIVATYWVGTDAWYNLGEFATKYDKTLNAFYMVHFDKDLLLENVEEILEEPSEDEIFIFSSSPQWRGLKYDLNFYRAEEYVIGYSGELEGFEKIDIKEMKLIQDFTNNEYVTAGSDSDGRRVLESGGMSYGPYWYVPDGDYVITINGESIENMISVAVCSDGGETHHDFEILESNEGNIVISLHLDIQVDDLEVVVTNISLDKAILNSIDIEGK